MGCIPGAAFRNQEYTQDECEFTPRIDYNSKMMVLDAQTSGGLLMTVPENKAEKINDKLIEAGYLGSSIIGEVVSQSEKLVYIE